MGLAGSPSGLHGRCAWPDQIGFSNTGAPSNTANRRRSQIRSNSEPIARVRASPTKAGFQCYRNRPSEQPTTFDQVPFKPIVPSLNSASQCSSGYRGCRKPRRKTTSGLLQDLLRDSDSDRSVDSRPICPHEQMIPGQLRDFDSEHSMEAESIHLPRERAPVDVEGSDVMFMVPGFSEISGGRTATPMDPKFSAASPIHAELSLHRYRSSQRIRGFTSHRCIPMLAHGLTLVLLAVSDILCFSEHWHDWQREEGFCLGLALGLLYACLIVWLVVQLMPDKGGRALRRLPFQECALGCECFVLAALHACTAFVSAWWRQTLKGSFSPGVRAAYVGSILQLSMTVLYAMDSIGIFVSSCVSFLTLIALEVLHSAPWRTVIDDTVLLASAAIACLLATRCTSLGLPLSRSRAKDYEKGPYYQLRDIFRSIIMEQQQPNQGRSIETHLDQLVSRLEEAKGATQRSSLDPELRDLLAATFDFFLNELAHMSSLGRRSMRELESAPPMTVEYVQRTLNQDVTAVHSTPRSSDRIPSSSRRASTGAGSDRHPSSNLPRASTGTTVHGLSPTPSGGAHALPGASSPSFRDSPPPPAEIKPMVQERELVHIEIWPPLSTFSTLENLAEMGRTTDMSLLGNILKPEMLIEEESGVDPEEDGGQTFSQGLHEMMEVLHFCQKDKSLPAPQLSDELHRSLCKRLGIWRFDIFMLNRLTGRRPLVVIGVRALASLVQRLELQPRRVFWFLDSVECRYNNKPYHNSMHGADVMNSMLYFLNMMQQSGEVFDPVESLAAVVAAGSHDVGHQGLTNGYHVAAGTALSRLYNDQSCLENMHSTITFSVLTMDRSNFIKDLPPQMRATFRAWVTLMILETDLSKHIQNVSCFKQEFKARRDPFVASTSARRKLLAAFALKCCDVAHSAKPFDLHVLWTLRINDEFFQQGDTERQLGLACSPFCDRSVTRVAESQVGFFDFIVSPLYTAIDEYLDVSQLRVEVLPELESNRSFWKQYEGKDFNYADPMSNAGSLRLRFRELNAPKIGTQGAQSQLSPEATATVSFCLDEDTRCSGAMTNLPSERRVHPVGAPVDAFLGAELSGMT